MLIYRVGPQPGGPSMCLTYWSTEKDLRQGSPLNAWTGRAMEKVWTKRPSDHQLQVARKKTLIEPQLLWERQSMSPAHLAPPGSLQAKQLATFTLSPHWGRVATVKKSLASMHTGSLLSCPALCDPLGYGLPGFSVQGLLQTRMLECIGQY